MQIQVTQKLHFSHEGREFTTLGPDEGIHDAPDYIINDPYFIANRQEGRIVVIGEDPTPGEEVTTPPVEPQEDVDHGEQQDVSPKADETLPSTSEAEPLDKDPEDDEEDN